jgi:uncharacterized protein
MRMILAGMLVLSAVPAAQAVSFDCAKAESPLTKAVCSSEELGHRDDVLAKAYATGMGGLSNDARLWLQEDQRNWIEFAGRACTPDATPFSAPLTEEQEACVAVLYRDRSEILSQSRMQGDWRIYPRSTYVVEDDPGTDPSEGVATKVLVTPRIDDTSETAKAFNALMEKAAAAAAPNSKDEDYLTSDTTMNAEVVEVTTHRITVKTDTSWYGHGAAHGNYGVSYTHFLTGKQRALEAADLFKGDGWQKPLGELVVAELENSLGEDLLFPEAKDDVPRLVTDVSRWNLTDYGLQIVFQPYEVAAYAVGAPTATIGWNKLSELLTDDYSELLY